MMTAWTIPVTEWQDLGWFFLSTVLLPVVDTHLDQREESVTQPASNLWERPCAARCSNENKSHFPNKSGSLPWSVRAGECHTNGVWRERLQGRMRPCLSYSKPKIWETRGCVCENRPAGRGAWELAGRSYTSTKEGDHTWSPMASDPTNTFSYSLQLEP